MLTGPMGLKPTTAGLQRTAAVAAARAGMAAAPYAPFCCQLEMPKEYSLHMPHVHCLRKAGLGGATLAYKDFCDPVEERRAFPAPALLVPILLTFHCLCLRKGGAAWAVLAVWCTQTAA